MGGDEVFSASIFLNASDKALKAKYLIGGYRREAQTSPLVPVTGYNL